MLAQLANEANYRPLVIDLFADQDTKALAEQVWQVDSLLLFVVQPLIESLSALFTLEWVVYGSGLEADQSTLAWLVRHFTVLGNSAAVFAQFSDKKIFFKQLDRFNIHYPEICFSAPTDKKRWLIKPMDHAGGLGIRWYKSKAGSDEYYQQFCAGQVGSVLFCADGQQVELIGFHRQWPVSQDDFTFAGIIQESILPEAEQQRVCCWLKKLVRYYGLHGLGSLDFIWDGQQCYFLEINPRPPASMMLYPELDLLTAHITGRLPDSNKDNTIMALQIVYAQQACTVPLIEPWPEWSFDQPRLGTQVQSGWPICSIMAKGTTVRQVLDNLLEKQKIIEHTIYK